MPSESNLILIAHDWILIWMEMKFDSITFPTCLLWTISHSAQIAIAQADMVKNGRNTKHRRSDAAPNRKCNICKCDCILASCAHSMKCYRWHLDFYFDGWLRNMTQLFIKIRSMINIPGSVMGRSQITTKWRNLLRNKFYSACAWTWKVQKINRKSHSGHYLENCFDLNRKHSVIYHVPSKDCVG